MQVIKGTNLAEPLLVWRTGQRPDYRAEVGANLFGCRDT